MTRYTTLNLPHFHKATVGFDRMFDELERTFANSKDNFLPSTTILYNSATTNT